MPRQVNTAGVALTETFETFVPFTYDDATYPPIPARADVPVRGTLTIGFGQTGAVAFFGNRCTRDQGLEWLHDSLQTKAAAVVERDCAAIMDELTDNQFATLADFVFRCGVGNFEGSTLLKDLKADDLADVPNQIAKWDISGGRKLPGLDRRCAAEVALWAQADARPEVADGEAQEAASGGADSPSQTTGNTPDSPATTLTSSIASPLEGEVDAASAAGGGSGDAIVTDPETPDLSALATAPDADAA